MQGQMQHEGEWGRHLWWASFASVCLSLLAGMWLLWQLIVALGLLWLVKHIWLLSFWRPTWWSALLLTGLTGQAPCIDELDANADGESLLTLRIDILGITCCTLSALTRH